MFFLFSMKRCCWYSREAPYWGLLKSTHNGWLFVEIRKMRLDDALLTGNIGLDKGGYPVNIFLISPQKHMLWVLIRSTSTKTCCGYSLEAPRRGTSNGYPQHIFMEK